MTEKRDKDLLSDSNESTRREFMKKAGKLAIYTPPAIMVLMHPNREAIARSPGKCNKKKWQYGDRLPKFGDRGRERRDKKREGKGRERKRRRGEKERRMEV